MSESGTFPRKNNPSYYPAKNSKNVTYWKKREREQEYPLAMRNANDVIKDVKSTFSYDDVSHSETNAADPDTVIIKDNTLQEDSEDTTLTTMNIQRVDVPELSQEDYTLTFPAVTAEGDSPRDVLPCESAVGWAEPEYDPESELDPEQDYDVDNDYSQDQEEESWGTKFKEFIFSPAGQVVIIVTSVAAVTAFAGYIMYLTMS